MQIEVANQRSSYVQAGMVGAALTANPRGPIPAGQNPGNIKFVQDNKTGLERMLSELDGKN